jgi:hypothetical protein
MVFLTATGAALGLVAYLVAPVVVSQERTFTTISTLGAVNSGGIGVGPSLITTICDLADNIQASRPATHVSCRDNYTGPGLGTLRVSSPSSAQTLDYYAALKTAADKVYYLAEFQALPAGPPISSRATAWKTAPASGAVLGFALAFIAPLPLRRRHRLPPPPEQVRVADDPPPPPPPPLSPPKSEPEPPPLVPPPLRPVRPIRPVRPPTSTSPLRRPRPTIPALDP